MGLYYHLRYSEGVMVCCIVFAVCVQATKAALFIQLFRVRDCVPAPPIAPYDAVLIPFIVTGGAYLQPAVSHAGIACGNGQVSDPVAGPSRDHGPWVRVPPLSPSPSFSLPPSVCVTHTDGYVVAQDVGLENGHWRLKWVLLPDVHC
jgi:hypothetical protein